MSSWDEVVSPEAPGDVAHLRQRLRSLEAELERRRQLEKALSGALKQLKSAEQERAHLLAQEVTQRRRMEALQSLTASLSTAVSREDVARVLVNGGVHAANAARGAVWCIGEDRRTLLLLHAVGLAAATVERYSRVGLESGLPLARCVVDRVGVWIQSRSELEQRFPEAAAEVGGDAEIALLCLPLLLGSQCFGALSIAFRDRRDFSEDERRLLTTIAHHCSQAFDRARLFDAEQRARLQAEAANRVKDDFLATVGHELRTPLNSIMGWSAIISNQGGALSPIVREAIDVIHRNADRQRRIIDDILDVSRIITGKLTIDQRPVDMIGIVKDAIEVVRPSAEAKGIAVSLAKPGSRALLVGDPGRLQQVVWNLLSNAVKFSTAGASVEVRVERNGPEVVVEVEDTGDGIDADLLPHVFERFTQDDSSSTRKHGGLGLGLAVVRHIVELHGGHVSAESPGIGRGSTFRVTLPVRAVAARYEPEDGTANKEHSSASGSTGKLAGLRGLVVDDEADARELVDICLSAEGAVVKSVGSATEALEAFDGFHPDFLVSDLAMPEIDGCDLIRELRRRPRERGNKLPAIALTAYARREDRMRVLASGFNTYLAKPVEPSELVSVIANLVMIGR